MNDRELEEIYLSGETVYNGKIINVDRWQVRLPNENTATREIVRHPGAAAIVPVDAAGYVTLVRQYRVAIGRMTWEIPAGKLDGRGEDPLLAAKRELEEETGLNAEKWQLLTRTATTPGFCDEHIAIYLATGLSQHDAHTDPDEFLRLTKMPLDQAVELCAAGELKDAKTIIGLMMAQRALLLRDKAPLFAPATIQRPTAPASSRQAKK